MFFLKFLSYDPASRFRRASLPMNTLTSSSFRRIVWPIAFAQTIVWAAMFYSFPALLLEWERDLGWSKTQLSGAFTSALVIAALLAPVAGRLIDRGLGRLVYPGSAILGALLLGLMSRVTLLWHFYAVWIGLGVAISGALYEASFAVITRALGAGARQAITLVTLIAGFAGTLAFPGAHFLVGIVGWRGAVQFMALAVVGLGAPLMWQASRAGEARAMDSEAGEEVIAPRAVQILGRPLFWLLALSFTMIALNHGVLITHLLPLLQERGVPEATAVFAASMIGPLQVAGRLAMLGIERYVSNLGITAVCFLAMGAAALALLNAGPGSILIVVFVVLQGSGYGVTGIMRPVVIAELLGRRNFGVLAGYLALPFLIATAAAPTIAALVWQEGGYDRVIWLAGGLAGIGFLAILAAGAFMWQRQVA